MQQPNQVPPILPRETKQSDFNDEEFYLPKYSISESILFDIKPSRRFKRGLFVAVNLIVLLGIVLVVFSRRTKSG